MTSVDDLMAASCATRRGLAPTTDLQGPLAMVRAARLQVHALASMTGGGHAVSGTVTTVGVAEARNATGGG
jgi:hypothetical protein